jgi:hypothetical protein
LAGEVVVPDVTSFAPDLALPSVTEQAGTPATDAGAQAALPGPRTPARRVVAAVPADQQRAQRGVALAVLFALGLALWWFGGAPARAPRRLGSLADGDAIAETPRRPGGIGRFARERDKLPPRL